MISIKKIISEAKEVKVYLQPGQKPPKGKKVVKGPKGGSYFMGSPEDKKTADSKPAGKTKDDKKYDFRTTKMGHNEKETKAYFTKHKTSQQLKDFISTANAIPANHPANIKKSKYTQNAVRWAQEILKQKEGSEQPKRSSSTGPKPLSQMGVEKPKEAEAKKEGAELSKALSQKFGRNNFNWEETKVVEGQIQHWFGVEDEIVKLSKKMNLPISKNRDTYLRKILDNVKSMGLPKGYVPVMRTIENAHSGRTLSTGSFLVLVKGE